MTSKFALACGSSRHTCEEVTRLTGRARPCVELQAMMHCEVVSAVCFCKTHEFPLNKSNHFHTQRQKSSGARISANDDTATRFCKRAEAVHTNSTATQWIVQELKLERE